MPEPLIKAALKNRNIVLVYIFFIAYVMLHLFVFQDVLNTPRMMHDFEVIYWKACTYAHGLNPYNNENVYSCIAGSGLYSKEQMAKFLYMDDLFFRFAYLPVIIKIFSLLTALGYVTAVKIFSILKGVALFALFCIWLNLIFPGVRDGMKNKTLTLFIVAAVIMLAWNSPITVDVLSGNISSFEQLFLWSGIFFFLRKRYFLFSFFIVLAALPKIIPIMFLVLLVPALFRKESRLQALSSVIFGLALFALIHAASYVSDPSVYADYCVKILKQYDESRGVSNPSLLSVVRDMAGTAKDSVIAGGIGITEYIYLALVALISTAYFYIVFKYKLYESPLDFTMFTCFYLAAIMPRIRNYSQIFLIPPTIVILVRIKNIIAMLLLLLLFIVPVFGVYILHGQNMMFTYWTYICFFIFIFIYIHHFINQDHYASSVM